MVIAQIIGDLRIGGAERLFVNLVNALDCEKKFVILLNDVEVQPNLLSARGSLWAQLKVLRYMGVATPQYIGFETFRFWLRHLNLKAKVRSISGTAKRVFVKRLRVRANNEEWLPRPDGSDV